jgi:hypothetical protein
VRKQGIFLVAAIVLSWSAWVSNAPASVTIASFTGGTAQADNAGDFAGQSFTTLTGSSWSGIAFNFYSFPGTSPTSTPQAAGTAFLLSSSYSGTPAALSSSTPGFVGSATGSGGFYTFGSTVTLAGGTTYFLYMGDSVGLSSSIYGAGSPASGAALTSSSTVGGYITLAGSYNFTVTSTTAVPEPSILAMTGAVALLCGGRLGMVRWTKRRRQVA